MERDVEEELLRWKEDLSRVPLIVRGARQVGKSYIIEKFGKEHFESLVIVNFELQPSFAQCFKTLYPDEIIQQLEVIAATEIVPGKTLLFLDEIQDCPQALLSLRYFKEKMPELHVIAAGSLLEFFLQDDQDKDNFSFPVGRVDFIYLKPLSFKEFIIAKGEIKAWEAIQRASLENPPSQVVHEHLLKLVRQYMLVGGMPAAVDAYIKQESFLQAQKIQQRILNTYRLDFGKYSTKVQYKYLQMVFEKAPNTVCRDFKYSKIDREIRSRELKTALDKLTKSGVLHLIFQTSASGIPLRFHKNENKFKILYLDVGLLQSANQIDAQEIWEKDLLQINQGVLAEQFVGQELIAYYNIHDERILYYWAREKTSSSAEVDYVVNVCSQVVPIEVKSGIKGRLYSLIEFMKEKNSQLGVKISEQPLSLKDKILSIPLYLIARLPDFVKTYKSSAKM